MSSVALATRLAVLALALASCSSDSGSSSDPSSGSSSASDDAASDDATPVGDEDAATSVLEDLTGDDFCAMLTAETIERALGVAVESTEGIERGRAPVMRAPYFLTRECDYTTNTIPALDTTLTTEWYEEHTDTDVLDLAFTDMLEETVGDYEDVPDLGIIAGFGPNPMLDSIGVAAARLEVVLRAGDERLRLRVSVLGRATLDQVRPLAEELVANLDF